MVAACQAAFVMSELKPGESKNIDWQRLFNLSQRHRVEALCWQGLQPTRHQIPAEVAEQFSQRSSLTVEANLRAVAECARLHSMLLQAGITHLFVKGLTLAALAYPQPFLKSSADIDLLVDPEMLMQAAQALRGAGYVPYIPEGADQEELGRWHDRNKESAWWRSDGSFNLDLHTRLADNPAILPGMGAASPSRMVEIASGISLPTLGKDELFAYLCVHGAWSAWFRLKWIADLAALLHRETKDEIARLYDQSQTLGAGLAADQALLLANELFGIDLPAELAAAFRSKVANHWLSWVANSQLSAEKAPLERLLGTVTMHMAQPFLQASWQFRLSEASRQFKALIGRA